MDSRLQKRLQNDTYRSLTKNPSLIDFASNDYLGLARSNRLKENFLQECASKKTCMGSTGSRLLTGNNSYIENLETAIASFHGVESALIFNCGFMANMGLITAVGTKNALIFFDLHIHASIREGIKNCSARAFAFKHNDLEHLERRLQKNSCNGERYICIESVYSTSGDIAPLLEIYQLAEKYEAKLIVDEAHSVGILGHDGRGLVSALGLSQKIFAVVVTFGKALGVFGAGILGDDALKNILINFSKTFIYTTALPLYAFSAIKCSYELLPMLSNERQHLQKLIRIAGFSKGPIQPIFISNPKHAKNLSKNLASKGFDVRELLSPTVQKGCEILRLCLHAHNKESELREILEEIKLYG